MPEEKLKENILVGDVEHAKPMANENAVLPAKVVPRNRLILLRYLEGQSAEVIAAHFGLQPGTISGIINSPLVRQEMEQISQNATGRIQNLTDEALDLVRDTMRGDSGSELRFKAANSLLDRNPELNPKRDSGIGELAAGLGEGIIRAIGKQLREMERPSEIPIIDIKGTDVSGGSDGSEAGGEDSGV
jgi:hypothetical protein